MKYSKRAHKIVTWVGAGVLVLLALPWGFRVVGSTFTVYWQYVSWVWEDCSHPYRPNGV